MPNLRASFLQHAAKTLMYLRIELANSRPDAVVTIACMSTQLNDGVSVFAKFRHHRGVVCAYDRFNAVAGSIERRVECESTVVEDVGGEDGKQRILAVEARIKATHRNARALGQFGDGDVAEVAVLECTKCCQDKGFRGLYRPSLACGPGESECVWLAHWKTEYDSVFACVKAYCFVQLRASDALQLAAAVVASGFQPGNLEFVTLDRRQAEFVLYRVETLRPVQTSRLVQSLAFRSLRSFALPPGHRE